MQPQCLSFKPKKKKKKDIASLRKKKLFIHLFILLYVHDCSACMYICAPLAPLMLFKGK